MKVELKFFVIILLISFSLLSCKGKEITSCDTLRRERDSLEKLLYLTRAFNGCKADIPVVKYYIVGKEYDLMKKNVITRVSGISREFKMCNDFSKHHFICGDMQFIDSIVIYGKHARVIGCFNPDYYTITGSDKDEYHVLKIKNKDKFWKDNVFLVIAHQ